MAENVEALLRSYNVPPGGADELFDASGSMRPVWAPFINHLSRFSSEEIALRFARGERYLHDAGVFFRKYDDDQSSVRDWPLSHLPVILHESDWREISAGLIQRAELLEQIAQDLYGGNTLVSDGHLPVQLVAQNPNWLRPLVGHRPVSGQFLNFAAFEIGRGPDGKWWVLGDRTEAPSGAGFALENRVATARIFPRFYASAQVHRLAGFFQSFQASLEAWRPTRDSEIAISTPGPMNDAYHEHAYIARYLGVPLIEGEDLVVRNGRAMLRTVDGLKPVGVLWRRQDAASCDPLELDENSHLGTPGLVDSVRQGQIAVVNALGTGVLETRAFLAFLPQICEALRDEPLKLPNIATWWCGQKAEQEHVLSNSQSMMIGPAFATRLPFDTEDGTALGRDLRGAARESVAALLAERGKDLVGQEAVTLSTTPVWSDAGLVPRPMILRVYLARTQAGWEVMPGGYARIGPGTDTTALSMQRGGSVADVWVISDKPVAKPSLLQSEPKFPGRSHESTLPSRAADNLFWLGRYVERTENGMRLFRAYYARRSEGVAEEGDLLFQVRDVLGLEDDVTADDFAAIFTIPLALALESAERVRDRFSVDGMTTLQALKRQSDEFSAQQMQLDAIPRRASELLRMITGFSGLVHENMYRSPGWRFLSLGMSLERAANTAALLSGLVTEKASDGALDLVLDVGDSTMTHRNRYSVGASYLSIADLMALDAANPRSILYHLARAQDQIDHLPGASEHGHMSPVARLAMQLHTRVAVETPMTLDRSKLVKLRKDIWRLSDLTTSAYMK